MLIRTCFLSVGLTARASPSALLRVVTPAAPLVRPSRGRARNASLEVLKINLRVMHEGLFHIDNLDLYQARHRNAFILAAAEKSGNHSRDYARLLMDGPSEASRRTYAVLGCP